MKTNTPTLEDFEALVSKHDVTYMMSDDSRYWKAGGDSMKKIKKMFDDLVAQDPANKEECVRIWNAKVDKSLIAAEAPKWYW